MLTFSITTINTTKFLKCNGLWSLRIRQPIQPFPPVLLNMLINMGLKEIIFVIFGRLQTSIREGRRQNIYLMVQFGGIRAVNL